MSHSAGGRISSMRPYAASPPSAEILIRVIARNSGMTVIYTSLMRRPRRRTHDYTGGSLTPPYSTPPYCKRCGAELAENEGVTYARFMTDTLALLAERRAACDRVRARSIAASPVLPDPPEAENSQEQRTHPRPRPDHISDPAALRSE